MFHRPHGRWTAAFLLTSILALGWIASAAFCGGSPADPPPAPATSSDSAQAAPAPSPDQSAPESPETSGDNSASSSDGSEPVPAYDFSQPAPERDAVDNSYFADAAFVGDSRTDGFLIYSGIG